MYVFMYVYIYIYIYIYVKTMEAWRSCCISFRYIPSECICICICVYVCMQRQERHGAHVASHQDTYQVSLYVCVCVYACKDKRDMDISSRYIECVYMYMYAFM
jgi:hypothetical protein